MTQSCFSYAKLLPTPTNNHTKINKWICYRPKARHIETRRTRVENGMCGTLLKFFSITQMVYSINCRSACLPLMFTPFWHKLANSLHSKSIFAILNAIAKAYAHGVELPKTFSAWKKCASNHLYRPNGLTMNMKCVQNFVMYSINLRNPNCSLSERDGRNFYLFRKANRFFFIRHISTSIILRYGEALSWKIEIFIWNHIWIMKKILWTKIGANGLFVCLFVFYFFETTITKQTSHLICSVSIYQMLD